LVRPTDAEFHFALLKSSMDANVDTLFIIVHHQVSIAHL